MRRRRIVAVVAVLAVVAVIVLGGGVAVGQLGSSSADRPPLGPPHFVDETASSGVDHTYTRRLPVFGRGRASRCSTATATAARTSTSPAAAVRRRSIGTRAPSAGRCGSRRSTTRSADLDRCHRRLPARRRRRRHHRSRRAPRSARTCSSAGSAAAGSSAPTRRGGSTAATRSRRPFSATWEGAAALPTLAFGNYIGRRRTRRTPTTCAPTTSSSGPRAGRRRATRRPIPLTPVVVRAVDAVQRLGPVRSPRPPDQQRPALLQRPERRPGPAVADRAGRAAAAVHRRRRLADRSGSRGWASAATT